jgi:hypothetical protein
VNLGSEEVAFLSVALLVGEHKVMRQIPWIAGPRYEVVHFTRIDSAQAIQAHAVLRVGEGFDHTAQGHSLRAE